MSETETTIENLNQIKNTLYDLENRNDISVFEFIKLISKYTHDEGETLKKVLDEDLSYFNEKAENKVAKIFNKVKTEHLAFERDYAKNIVSLLSAIKDILETINKEHPNFNLKLYESDRKYFIKKLYVKKKVDVINQKKHDELTAIWNSHKKEFKRLQEENKDLYNTLNDLQREFEFKDNRTFATEQRRLREIDQLKAERIHLQDQLNQLQSTIDNILSVKNNRKKRSPFGSPDRRYMPKSELRYIEENSNSSKKESVGPSTSRLPPIKLDYWNPLTTAEKSLNDYYQATTGCNKLTRNTTNLISDQHTK